MTLSSLLQMSGNQFPFDLLDLSRDDYKTMQVKKRYLYKNNLQLKKLQDKITKLHQLSHKNLISICDNVQKNGYIYLFYSYVPYSLKEFLYRNSRDIVKQLHRQFIELVIYLAKNDILTSFKSDCCGIIVVEGKPVLQYYLPLNEIIITDQVSMLQRSVQLFNLQSMHYLGMLVQQISNITQNDSSPCELNKTITTFPMIKTRNQSQPISLKYNQVTQSSINLNINPQLQKISNLSKQLCDFSEMRKQHAKDSTHISTISFNTANSMISSKSQDMLMSNIFSENKVIRKKFEQVRDRSLAALKKIKQLKGKILDQVQLPNLFRHQSIKK